jgi:hypothetical protein
MRDVDIAAADRLDAIDVAAKGGSQLALVHAARLLSIERFGSAAFGQS